MVSESGYREYVVFEVLRLRYAGEHLKHCVPIPGTSCPLHPHEIVRSMGSLFLISFIII